MTKAAFSASYADWKLIRTRKVVQIVFEVPVEMADAAYQTVGGMPHPGESKWFAIARLKEEPKQSALYGKEDTEGVVTLAEEKKYKPRSLAQKIAIKCSDPLFIKFLHEHHYGICESSADAAVIVRDHCEVKSRSEITEGSPASYAWYHLNGQFEVWKLEPQVGA